MAEEMKKNDDIMDGQGETEDDFKYDPEKGGNAKLCPNGRLYENNLEKNLFSHDIPLSLQQVIRVMQSVVYHCRR